ncbi:MAG: HAD family hydrolase [Acidimicrobiales bacterium]
MIRAVAFDVGEVLVDETREYGTWADWLGVPRHTFSAVFGATIARGGDYREAFQVFRPGFTLDTQRKARADAGVPESFGEDDLYPDVRPCLGALRGMGLRIGLAGNQTTRAEGILKTLCLPVDWIGTSEGWGVEKPSPGFFRAVVTESGVQPAEVLYVGDRLDNDVSPAQREGLATALVRRGPWGYLLRDPEAEAGCLCQVDGLAALAELVREHNDRSTQ